MAPIHILRPLFLHLGQQKIFDSFWPDILKELVLLPSDVEVGSSLEFGSSEDLDQFRLTFRHSLTIELFGCETFHSMRLRLAIADFCWVNLLVFRFSHAEMTELLLRTFSFQCSVCYSLLVLTVRL